VVRQFAELRREQAARLTRIVDDQRQLVELPDCTPAATLSIRA